MGDYGEETFVELNTPNVPFELKAGASLFPLLTDGILLDDHQRAVPLVASGLDQTRLALELRSDVSAVDLTDFCTRHGVTLLSVLNVAWSLVLAAYADTDVVNVLCVRYAAGVPYVGFSETTIDGERTVQQTLTAAEQQLSTSAAVPLATSLADLQNATALNGRPVFNSIVLYSGNDNLEGAEAGDYIALHARATLNRLEIHLQAPTHLLPAAHAQHCAATLSHVLGEIIQHPDLPIAKINLLSLEGLQQISYWNRTAPTVVSRCLHQVVDETALAQPDALAIDGTDGRMTYGELQAQSNRLAQHLVQLGVGPEVAVPLFFEKSKWAIVTMIAVVKAGGVIVNLDAKQPRPRLQGLLAQLQTTLVITSVQHSGLWADEFHVVVVSEDFLNQLPIVAGAPVAAVTPHNALYIIFTSGSTGTPKGCVVEHESFLTAAAQHVQAAHILSSSRVLQMTPYTFDVSMLEIFTTLTTGACICFCSEEEAAHGIAHIINHLQITWTFMTPSLVRLVDPASVPTLKTLALGGEGLGRIDVTTWADKLHLVNGYGPSECSVAATINEPLSLTSDPANIGVGCGAVCWVVHPDDHDQLVPIGAVGELLIQGPIVARGYLNEPAKTAAVFLDKVPAFAELLPQPPPAHRLYKTGDLVRQNSDGTLNFIGRKDRQVKLNGQRLELGEIEQRLSQDSLVRHALIVLPKEGPCKGRLVAVLSLHAVPYDGRYDAIVHSLPTEESKRARGYLPEITAQLSTQLPAYMVPTFWVVLAALPFTTSGKIHGVAMTQWLREMSEETYREIADVSDDAPETGLSTEIELLMQQIWAEELGIPVAELKANRSFIALGGDSLAAMMIVARCRQQQLMISVPDVLRAPNLIDVAARTTRAVADSSQDEEKENENKAPAGLISRDQVEDTYRCSPMQDGILLSQVKFPGTYEVLRVLRVQSTLDAVTTVARLQDAWQAVVNRHQMLRTIFFDAAGQFQQIVLKQVPACVQTYECLDLADERAVTQFLQNLPPPTYHTSQPQHRLTICRAADDSIFIKVEISHALIDGGSTEVVLHELSLAFDHQSFSTPPALFSDYIEFISRPQAANISLNYWATYLDGVQPTIVPMYPTKGGQKQIRSVSVPFTDASALLRFTEVHGVTLANVLQTAWALVLRAYTDTDDVCFGYIAAGRDVPIAGIDQAVGVFINMLVCRVRLDQKPTVLESVMAMQNEYFEALPHQHTSLAQIQHRMDMSGMSLFNSIVSVQKDVSDQPHGESLSFQPLQEDDPTDFDLAVAIHVGKKNVKIDIGYWSSMLSDGDAANLANTFKGAISSILMNPQSPPTTLDLFTDEDRAQIFDWNQNEPIAAPGVVHDHFYARVQQQPGAPAVCAWDGEYSYAELDQLSEKLAHHLVQLGAGPEVLIPHCFPKSKLATVAMVAIMKSGSAGVGLSAAHPRTRVQDIVKNCAANIAVVAAQNVLVVEGLIEHIVVIDEDFLAHLPDPQPHMKLPQAQPCNPAFVSFTSGSTGKPKGIVLEHGSLITSILAHGSSWDVDQSARVLQFSAYAFDANRVDDLVGAINRLGVNWAFLTPRVLGLLSPEAVPTLKTVILGGEAISQDDIARWTEGNSHPNCLRRYAAVGNTPENTEKLMPIGCTGELIIEGPLVTRGYLNEPVKTKAAYIEDPVWLPKRAMGEPRRFYKTSDLVRYYPDGQLRFIGRKDTQIKVRGQRVELGEIEHAILTTMPSAVHITVDSVKLPSQKLVAFLYLNTQSADKEPLFIPLTPEMTEQLRALEKDLSETLPGYMVPSLFIPISHIPLTISNKVDRIALRRAALSLSTDQQEMYALAKRTKAAPEGPQEEHLRDLWAMVLGKEPTSVGRHDNFFRLGGDSIGAMKLVAAARRSGFVLSVADIFRQLELSDMAKCLHLTNVAEPVAYTPFSLLPADSMQRETLLAEAAMSCSISSDAIQDAYPATPLQEGVFLMSTTHKGAYVAPTAFRLPVGFDVSCFQGAWQALVNAHPILRTRLVTIDATSYQVVLTPAASCIEWEKATSLSEYLARIQALPVVAGAPLTRYALISEGDSNVFVWTAHHASFDGWTIGLLLDQLAQLYKHDMPPKIAASYAEFVQYMQKADKDASSKFWASLVPSEPPAVFPRLPSAVYQPTAKETCYRTISSHVQEESNFTLAVLLRAAWSIVLARYTDAENILYGLTLSGRDVPVPGIERVMGPTITTVPMNVHLDGEMLVQTFLQQQQDQNVEMMNHQHVGLQAIRCISPAAAAATEFTNLFVVQPQTDEVEGLNEMAKIPTDMTRFDPYALVVECNLADSQVHLEARFDDAVLPTDRIQRLLGHFEHVLSQLIRLHPGRRLREIDVFSTDDERQIWEWNAAPAKSENMCVHELIAEQAQRHSDHIAIDAWDGSLTYNELEYFSSQLSHWLAANLDFRPESLVPLCFDKSRWTIVVMLAVVKCGGGCVMLNPDHPISRLEGVIAHTASSVVLASPERMELFASGAATVVAISEALIRSSPALTEKPQPLPLVQPTNPIFVIFTSGSSGKPKGIVVQHNSVCTVAIQHGEGLGFTGPGLRVLQFASFSFDVSMGEVFVTLMKGGTLCIPTEYDRINHLAATINRMQITWTFMAPTVAALLDPRDVPELQTLVLGGEAVSQSLVDQWASHVNLVDSYGPAECTIWASHANSSPTVSPANIGRGIGCRFWVVDIQDHNRLAPIGCVGELLIEGPNVSRGYLNEPEKTTAAFIENPIWLHGKEIPQYKFYCTGDLVRYNADGSLNIAGRKDSQVKHHGQRIELGEIEFHLRAHSEVDAGMVMLPKAGPCQSKLVAVVALTDLHPVAVEGDHVALIHEDLKTKAQPRIQQVKEELAAVLPPYMVPTIWIVVDSIPLTASRKINRMPISRWVDAMSEETYRAVVDIAAASVHLPVTQLEKQLANVWSHVLNLPVETIGLNRSFLSLGGDSITAMQVVSRCRALEIEVSVQDILQSKSLAGVAARALAARPRAVLREEQYGVPFELSPIQQLYFDEVVRSEAAQNHYYHQSVLLRVTRPISLSELSRAIAHIVTNHAMLRAQFSQQADAQWTQLVQSPDQDTTPVASHHVANRGAVFEIVEASHRHIDIEHGPIFVVDHFVLPDEEGQLLSLIAHHLVVDAVSWHIIIGQLEQLLLLPDTQRPSRMPFQNWVQEQRQYAEQLPISVLSNALPAANLEYWGLEQLPTWQDGEEVQFTLDSKTTALLLTTANTALRTEPVDLLVSALQQSFAKSFSDRAMPTIFTEGHGREPWDASIDLSETIGWFTTFYPIHRRLRQNESFKHTVKRIKDARRAVADNGFAYFTQRHFSTEARKEFAHHSLMEICFNYLGQAQHTERADALFQEEPLLAGESLKNIGDKMGRLAVFDITAAVSQGRLTVSFFFNRAIEHQERIRQWVQCCETELHSAVNELAASGVEYTLSDFPLLQIDYQDLTTLTTATLPAIGLSLTAIEDIYPCSPIQEGILISQARQPGTYEVRQLFKIVPRVDIGPVDIPRLLQAWQRTVDRHALLRTIFIESVTGPGVYDQLVLRTHAPEVRRLSTKTPRMMMWLPPGAIYCQLEVSHALIDGTSMALLVRDLVSAYENNMPPAPGPLYSDYMAYIASRPQGDALAYWTSRLAEVEPCHFPELNSSILTKAAFQSQTINIDADGQLQRFCESNDLTLSNLFQAAWGLVLRAYTGRSDVCFGYMASGRDIPMDGIYEAIGPFINLLVCQLHVGDAVSVHDLLQAVQSDYLNSLPHQQTSLASIQHALGKNEVALFNTILSLQREPAQGPPPQVEFEIVDQTDPTEYDVDINITTSDELGVEIHLTYRTALLNEAQADSLLQTFTHVLLAMATRSNRLVSNLDVSSPVLDAPSQIIPQPAPAVVDASVSELIAKHAEQNPMSIAVQSADGQVTLTYSDLNLRASALAGHLRNLAVKPGDIVLLSFPRSPWAMLAMLAVLRTGATWLALDPLEIAHSLRETLSVVRSSVVLCAADHAARFDETALTPVIVDAAAIDQVDAASAVSQHFSCVSPTAAALALKDGADWALLAHRTISTVASQLGPLAGLGPDARVLQFNPVNTPFYLVETLYPLINGGTVVTPAEGASFTEAMRDSQANWAMITPTVAALTYPAQLPHLQTLVVAGEDVAPALLNKWRDIKLIHPGGSTHFPVWLSLSQSPANSVSLQPLSEPHLARFWIRSPFSHTALASTDCVGEVLVDGPMVPQSYLRNPKNRIMEGASWLPGKTLYCTGDLGRWTADQQLSVVRSSRSIPGHATSLVSLEHLVQAALPATQHSVLSIIHCGSCEQVALFHVDCSQQIQMAPALLPMSDALQQQFQDLKASLREHVPEALLPIFFFPLSSVPLTADHDLDRTGLRPTAARLTANEQLLADLWAEVLHLPDRGTLRPTDSFFRLGEDSIGAMRIISLARNQGLVLTMNGIFQRPTLADMAQELRLLAPHEDRPLEPFSLLPTSIESELLVTEAAQKCKVDPATIEDVYPCTPLQEGLMVLTSQDPTAYVVQEVFHLPESVDIARFQAAWAAVIARSTILRTRIIVTAEGTFQVLLQKPITWASGSDLPTYLGRDAIESMTYGQPLVRFALLETPEQRYFVWTAHHAVYDGLTMPTLARQVSAEYNQEIYLPEVPYNRFINYIQGINPAAATEFWMAQCSTPAAFFPVLPTRSFQASPDQIQIHSVPVSRSPSDITLSTVLRAAWAIVLAHRTDSEHVSFGVTLSGRNAALAGINQVLGPTIATIPVHIQVCEGQSPFQFLQAVHQQSIKTIPFEHTGLQNIRRMGDQAREAVDFQNLLLIQPGTTPIDESDFLGLTPIELESHQADPYPLTLECNLFENRVEIKAQFDSRLITESEMSTILKHYARAIERLQAVQDTTTDDATEDTLDPLGTLSPEDHQQILTWNADRPLFVDSCVHEQFEEKVLLQPDAPAVSSFDVELTYRELNVLVDKLATELLARGVKPEMNVPLCFSKCSWTIVAMFAVMKVGGVGCMLNPEHPSSRIQLLLNDLNSNLVLCSPESAAMLSLLLPPGGVLPVDGTYLQTLPPRAPLGLRVQPQNAVFVVYTSGSTGKPKGSILEHRSLVTGLRAHCTAMGIGPGTRTFQFAAYTFDVCFEEIIGSLMLGACVCVPSETERMNALADAMARYRVTWTELTPTVASLLLPSSIPTLQTLALSGESLTKEVIQRWADAVKIINTYGPSECCVSSTCNVHTATLRDPSNIGRGLGCTTWIVDPENIDRLVPIGTAGELLIEGPIVARGYLNEPEKTAAAFITAPAWWPESYQCGRIYRTGDLVRYNADGTIKFLGRKDTQVKLHGQRIELGEIEHRIRSAFADASHQVAVEVLTPTARNKLKVLTAFICESDAVSEDVEHLLLPLEDGRPQRFLALQARLLADLPRHMVPQLFIPVSHMPLSPARKLERKSLRAVGNGLTHEQLAAYALTQVAKTAPTTAMEKALADIWAQVLATKAGLPLSVADIMQFPTLGAIAAAMDRASIVCGLEETTPAPLSLVPAGRLSEVLAEATAQCAVAADAIEDIYPCTPSQEALMALTARDETAYVSRAVYRLPLNLDLDRYRQAWEVLARRQAIMRTRIIYSNAMGQSFQVVVHEDLVWQSGDSVPTYLAADKLTPMHIGQALMRFAILAGTIEDPRSSLVYTAHHAVYDGWSEAAMFDEAEAIYRHGLSALPTVVPYNKFIHYLTTIDAAASDQFWRTQLDGDLPAPFPPAPPATAASALTSRPNRSQSHAFSIPSKSLFPYTTPTILKAAWALLLERYTTSQDVIFGHVLSGRTVPLRGVADMMGPTISTVPVRVRLAKDESTDSFLRKMHEQAQAMAPFEQIGLQHIRRLLPAAESIDVGHLFFIQPQLDTPTEGLGLEPLIDDDFDFETYPLIVECQLATANGLNVLVKHDDARIAPAQMTWLLQHFEHLVHQLCQQPRTTALSDLALTGSSDLVQLQQWMGPPVAPVATTLHDQFQALARAHPERCAIDAWDGQLTYGELDRLSLEFAQELIGLGFAPGQTVGLTFDKSRWAIVALLAVLRAGGACVHLDPQHPPARLLEIATDVGLAFILTAPQHAHLGTMLAVRHVLVVDAITASKASSTSNKAQRLPVVDLMSPAYLTFTSGSTGKPKSVVIDHRAIHTSIVAFSPVLHLTPDSRVLQFAAYTFDISYAEIFAPLVIGATVCVLSEHDRLNDLAGAINRLGVNWACLTPTVARLVEPVTVASLQTLVLSGECPTEDNLRTWVGKVPTLINAYGPSEASVWCAVGPFTRVDDSFANIGRPVGCRLWIAEPDNLNRLTPLGCVGELLVEGPILSKGYLNNEQASSTAFCQDLAWMPEMHFRADCPLVYRTGDLARYLPDGRIEYLGRKDTQVKVYGRRIEPNEIEHHIRTHLHDYYAMVDSVTLASRNDQKVLVAYVYQESGRIPDMDLAAIARPLSLELRQTLTRMQTALRAQLPSYMLPTLFIPLQLMPTNAAGKIDRKLLSRAVKTFTDAQLEEYSLLVRAAKRPLETPLEHRLAGLWAEVLAVDAAAISPHDTFFGLGGDSIMAMKLASLARSTQLSLTVADIFNHPILADLAAYITTQMPPTPGAETPPLAPKSTTAPAPVLNLALVEALAPRVGVDPSAIAAIEPTTDFQDLALVGHLSKSRWMLNWFYFDGTGAADIKRLRQGCYSLVQHFDILRTIFAHHAGQFWQVVLHELQPSFRVETTANPVDFAQSLYNNGIFNDFQMSKPFVQFVLAVHPDGQSHRLLMRLSHAQYDGVSLPTLWESLQRACQGHALPATPSFAQFLQATSPADLTAARSYWRTLLADAPETRFVAHSKPALRDDSHECVLHVTRSRIPVNSLSQYGITAATVLKSAWAVLLARLAASSDVVFGHTVANRSAATVDNIDTVVGPCLNVVPVRARLQPGQTVLELLLAQQQQQVANLPRESLGFRQIIRDCTDWPSWTHFSSVVQHQNIEPDRAVLPGQDQETLYEPGFLGADLDLTDVSVLSTPVDDGYVDLDLLTSSAIMSPFAAELLIDQLSGLLRSWAVAPVERTLAYEKETCHALLPLPHKEVLAVDGAMKSPQPTSDSNVRAAVLEAWRTVLPIGLQTDEGNVDFFEASGDLVNMAQLVSELHAHGVGAGVRLETLVQHSSLDAMVQVLL
ncbi:AMP-dependent synthetase/ligase [Penicillium maclennaniae]|uniref:AMP-dependent synthetase/ligase n=1 Tax=Penicillium maclennaniae TaxID=1343394 RepID=UPI0025411946|nr:AMP-dependent synthetase/ligase [Penicillium maclennaniae]KAJ5674924.1 AMP-dependent synthetase/ligase [Penicillium maclennaniae]